MPWVDPTGKLTHRFPLTSTTALNDTIGSITATAVGNVTNDASGPVAPGATAVAFGSNTGRLNLSASPIANTTGPHSAFIWAKITDIATDDGNTAQTPFVFFIDASNTARFSCRSPNGVIATSIFKATAETSHDSSAAEFVNGTWVHVGYTWSGTVSILYQDGAVAAGDTGGLSQPNSSNIGSRDSDGTGAFTGSLYSLCISDQVLSEAEVLALFNATEEPAEPWPPPGSPAGPQLRQIQSGLRW